MKKALILAAGIGKRLGELTRDIPKCLLPVGSKTLLDYSLEAISGNDFEQVTIITGFAEKKLKEHIKKWERSLAFKLIYNDKFADYNNIYSAYLAKDIWDDETILFNSDIIFHPLILKDLVSNIKENSNKSYLVIDDTKILIAEDMKVKINSLGEIKEINKGLDIKTSYGEYIGVTYSRGKERENFLESLELNVKNKNLDIYYEDALAHVLDKISVFPYSTKSRLWTEVDTKEDYELAKRIASEIKINAL